MSEHAFEAIKVLSEVAHNTQNTSESFDLAYEF